jgi:hypothetical protein
MNAPTPLVVVNEIAPEDGGQGPLVDHYSDTSRDEPAVLELRFQNNRDGRWSKIKTISLGAIGESDIIREISPMGTYITRQYELVFSGTVAFGLFALQEEVKALE